MVDGLRAEEEKGLEAGKEGRCGMRWSWVVVIASGVRGRCDLSLCVVSSLASC